MRDLGLKPGAAAFGVGGDPNFPFKLKDTEIYGIVSKEGYYKLYILCKGDLLEIQWSRSEWEIVLEIQ
jgi:hypothetical protein